MSKAKTFGVLKWHQATSRWYVCRRVGPKGNRKSQFIWLKSKDPVEASAEYYARLPKIESGEESPRRKSPKKSAAMTLKQLTVKYLEYQEHRHKTGNLAVDTLNDSNKTVKLALEIFDPYQTVESLSVADFTTGKRKIDERGWSPTTINNAVRRLKAMFRYSLENDLVSWPNGKIPYGTSFRLQKKNEMMIQAVKTGKHKETQVFTREELWQMLNWCDVPLPGDIEDPEDHDRERPESAPNRIRIPDWSVQKGYRWIDFKDPRATSAVRLRDYRAMIMLSLNSAGLENSVIGTLTHEDVYEDETGQWWLTAYRKKTGIKRRIPLWNNTMIVLHNRGTSSRFKYLFVTRYDSPYYQVIKTGKRGAKKPDGTPVQEFTVKDEVGKSFKRIMKSCGINGKRSWYNLRKTVKTAYVNLPGSNPYAVESLAGHRIGKGIEQAYIDHVSDEELIRNTKLLEKWLYEGKPAFKYPMPVKQMKDGIVHRFQWIEREGGPSFVWDFDGSGWITKSRVENGEERQVSRVPLKGRSFFS
jgi:integrase